MPELLPIQTEGVNAVLAAYRAGRKAFLIADRVGVGKTAQAIKIIQTAIAGNLNPAIVIVPAYLVYNWLDEFELWGIDPDSVCVIDSTKQIIEKARIYLTSYNTAVNVKIHNQLLKKEYSLLVCDESHYLKAWNSQRSNKILGTGRNKKSNLKFLSKRVLLLSGTPVLNTVEDIYTVLIKLTPEIFGNIDKIGFLQKFAARVEFTPWGVKSYGVKNEKELIEALDRVMIRRSITGELPPKIEHNINLGKGSEAVRRLIASENEAIRGSLENVLKLTKFEVEKLSEYRRQLAIFKLNALPQLLADIREKSPDPVLIYCYHKDVLREMLTLTGGVGVSGETPLKKRAEIVKKFQAGEIPILCATISSLKEGVNLTAGATLIFIELDWTPANIEQAIGRLHRRGQQNTVNVYYVYFDGGVDKHVVNVVRGKDKMIKKILKS